MENPSSILGKGPRGGGGGIKPPLLLPHSPCQLARDFLHLRLFHPSVSPTPFGHPSNAGATRGEGSQGSPGEEGNLVGSPLYIGGPTLRKGRPVEGENRAIRAPTHCLHSRQHPTRGLVQRNYQAGCGPLS